ncbi:MAG: universal stress protein, partial [Anaerolineales bacterium]
MNEVCDPTGGIVCATRGGEGSELTIEHAIARAKELNLQLIFLYIADVEFMKHTEMGRTALVADEMRKMGEFIMLTLVERAGQKGVTAGYAVRQGDFHDQLVSYLEERQPELLVLGSPLPDTSYFQPEGLGTLAEQ